VYFNAAWSVPFKRENTADGPFTRLDGSSVSTALMRGDVGQRYAEGSGWKAAEVDYDGDQISMLIIVPDEGSFAAFEQSLDEPKLAAIGAALESKDVGLVLPKLEIRTHQTLASALQKMGMLSAFVPEKADLSGIDGTRALYVSEVIHEAFVKTNENGT